MTKITTDAQALAVLHGLIHVFETALDDRSETCRSLHAYLAARLASTSPAGAWPATKEEMDAYWKAYSENRVHGEGAAIRAGLQAYQAILHPEQAKDGAAG